MNILLLVGLAMNSLAAEYKLLAQDGTYKQFLNLGQQLVRLVLLELL